MILAKIPYLNTAPYFHFLSQRWLDRHQIVNASPRRLGEIARQGGLDAGLFSQVDAWDLVESGEFEYLGKLGIAGSGPIQSILLLGPENPRELEGRSICVTSHTATSSRLMQVWLKEKVGLKSWKEVASGGAAASLLIGDEALARSLRPLPGDGRPTDLCAAWTAWTGLPFVFARWAVKKSLPIQERRELLVSLQSAMELAMDDLETVCASLAQDSPFEAEFIAQYLKGITFRLGAAEEQGSALFKDKLAAYNGNL